MEDPHFIVQQHKQVMSVLFRRRTGSSGAGGCCQQWAPSSAWTMFADWKMPFDGVSNIQMKEVRDGGGVRSAGSEERWQMTSRNLNVGNSKVKVIKRASGTKRSKRFFWATGCTYREHCDNPTRSWVFLFDLMWKIISNVRANRLVARHSSLQYFRGTSTAHSVHPGNS